MIWSALINDLQLSLQCCITCASFYLACHINNNHCFATVTHSVCLLWVEGDFEPQQEAVTWWTRAEQKQKAKSSTQQIEHRKHYREKMKSKMIFFWLFLRFFPFIEYLCLYFKMNKFLLDILLWDAHYMYSATPCEMWCIVKYREGWVV